MELTILELAYHKKMPPDIPGGILYNKYEGFNEPWLLPPTFSARSRIS